MAGFGRSPDQRGAPGPVAPLQSPDTTRQVVRSEIRRLAGSVGDPPDLATFAGLEEQAESLPIGSPERRGVERRMRRIGPPTETQIFLKRLFGLGIVGALALITVITGEQSVAHAITTQTAVGDIQTTLQHLSIFNVGDAGQRIMTDLQTAETNAVQTVIHGVEAGAGAIAEAAAVAQKPWKRPRRRGIFF